MIPLLWVFFVILLVALMDQNKKIDALEQEVKLFREVFQKIEILVDEEQQRKEGR